MEFSMLVIILVVLQAIFPSHGSIQAAPANSNLFREYIGAESNNVRFTDVPISSDIVCKAPMIPGESALDSGVVRKPFLSTKNNNNGIPQSPLDHQHPDPFLHHRQCHVTPEEIASVKDKHSNVKVAVSLGGDSVGSKKAFFAPKSIDSWVQNAISSLTNPRTFAECVGRLITTLKKSRTMSFASIAPYDDGEVQSHYLALWKKYGHAIDHVNFQFYAYEKSSVSQFVKHFDEQASNYGGGQILASFSTDDESEGGLGPDDGFFEACREL
ncbi:hypothetical protein POTOM_050721 [Populus tomentosa]|uniref:GH18 domain-containing protein n=1 Tax=Populus tomentosa TaxID=118781 RepID=A0A8X7Y487_POPTO|nr:hypothetical protein POTOM_050721 [Populus tomentosa]